jgi:hypothetical protein
VKLSLVGSCLLGCAALLFSVSAAATQDFSTPYSKAYDEWIAKHGTEALLKIWDAAKSKTTQSKTSQSTTNEGSGANPQAKPFPKAKQGYPGYGKFYPGTGGQGYKSRGAGIGRK